MTSTLLTPETVLNAASLLGIDYNDQHQTHLLATARAYCELPLPSDWKRVQEGGGVMYLDTRTAHSCKEHPLLRQFQDLVQFLATHPPEGHENQTQMTFRQYDGSSYVHDFAPMKSNGGGKLGEATGDAGKSDGVELEAKEPGESDPPKEEELIPGAEAIADAPETTDTDAIASADAPVELPGSSERIPGGDNGITKEKSGSMSADTQSHTMIAPVSVAMLEAYGIIKGSEPVLEQETLSRLQFYSWWYEDIESNDLTFRVNGNSVAGGGLKKRYVTVIYHLGSSTFSIRSENEDQELVIPASAKGGVITVSTKSGAIAELWDLHVGATINVLGKSTTLMKAENETAKWLEAHAMRLRQMKSELVMELQKYKPKARSAAVTFNRGDRIHTGGLNLRYTVDQVNTLLQELEKYRPAKAESMRAKIGIYPRPASTQ